MAEHTVLVVGGGGREHALAWKLAQSPKVDRVLVAPGNAGTATEPLCENVPVAADDIDGLLALADREAVALTVVGPEAPLAAGIVDRFRDAGLRCFGPTQAGAQLESSKAFAKAFMQRHGIPTAAYAEFTDTEAALAYLREQGAPIVIKADGLAAGKGVVVAQDLAEAEAAVRDMLDDGSFGAAGARVVIEEFLPGEEASFIVMAAGQAVVEFASSQDHKPALDGDQGPNTGGMGAYSPAPVVTPAIHEAIRREVIDRALAGFAADGIEYLGFLYAGLMVDDAGNIKVLEFNCRLGDPETQPLLMRLDSDLFDLCLAAVDGHLGLMSARWNPQAALGVVMAAGGYPGAYDKGLPIQGLAAAAASGAKVFHAGTAQNDEGDIVTSGGRVLCVTALGDDVAAAQQAAYAGADRITWDKVHLRRDIGAKAIGR
ncbi:phosphoribosylamine--glycine ligase [Abyssibacter sp.]|jgi:phosphoribosylamine--glycine ligase|uniref:phosphoribosylamine--glycine ligase n=1 Tax=Abyssibacter sp. TaxID=2320200 RepID=UPI000C57DF12|nr:phosphoribosylamine--glycine ligase [Abyssibacter sp.]MBB86522.1 phosphoribosylamine--glycine ligase [Xanthomonadales bacterium]MCK5859927.1 phosphoribosylamine--glycine ligase [Abyssibacter sp.]